MTDSAVVMPESTNKSWVSIQVRLSGRLINMSSQRFANRIRRQQARGSFQWT